MVTLPIYRDAIASIESAGSGGYSARGPTTRSGDRAYGRYQVMGNNIPQWTEEVLGRRLTPTEFLNNPQAQDAVFDAKFGEFSQRYGGPDQAASVWFTGKPIAEGANRQDQLGTSGREYVDRFINAVGQRANVTPAGASAAPQQAGLLAGGEQSMANGDEPQGLLAQLGQPDSFLGSSFLSNLGAGILAANRQGEPLGSAIGQGLLQANQANRAAGQDRLRNEIARQQISQRQRKQQAGERLRGLLADGVDPNSPEFLGLLAETNPEAVSQAMIGQAFGQERALPADIRTMDALGIPRTPEGFQSYQEFKANGSGEQLDQAVKLLQFNKLRREEEEAQQTAQQDRVATRDTLRSSVKNIKELADLNDRLEGTGLETGVGMNDLRRTAISGGGAVQRALGIGGDEAGRLVADFDRFNKLANDYIVDLINKLPGQTTNQKMELLQSATVSASAAPGANRLILADLLEKTFAAADREGFEIPDREQGEQLIERLRSSGREETEAEDQTSGVTPEGRPIVQNPDGTVSTERTITVTNPEINNGRPTNIPSMFGGRQVSQQEAIGRIIEAGGKDPETGRALKGFDSIDEAVAAAQERSQSLGRKIDSGRQSGDRASRTEGGPARGSVPPDRLPSRVKRGMLQLNDHLRIEAGGGAAFVVNRNTGRERRLTREEIRDLGITEEMLR